MAEDDGGVEPDEGEEGVEGDGDEARAGLVAGGGSPPPDEVEEPDGNEGVVDPEAAAGIDAGEGGGLAGGGGEGVGVAPVMDEVEGAEDMDNEQEESEGPGEAVLDCVRGL